MADGALPGLERAGLVRSVRTPEFAGVTFHEVMAKSALSKNPGGSLPFRWSINPYRGCTHACRYCFARPTHRYLDLDAGRDFDSEIVVKVNIVEVLRGELRRRSWARETVALGTNTDPYQRAEGRYQLMPGIIAALAESGTPVSILTKGTLARRDLPLLADAAQHVPVSVSVSLAMLDEQLQESVEPGTPTPRARLELISAIHAAGLRGGVMVAPVLPWLTDSVAELTAVFDAVKAAGAESVTVLPLNLKPGAREWYFEWLAREHPRLVPDYERLFRSGPNTPRAYRSWLWERVRPLLQARDLLRKDPAEDSSGKEGLAAGDVVGHLGPPPAPADTLF